jgi:hypothetical protein
LVSLGMVTSALDAPGQSAPTIGPEAYMDQAGYWPPDTRPLAVCWVAPEPQHEAQRQMVRDSVRKHIEDPSGMRFAGIWLACAGRPKGDSHHRFRQGLAG